MRSSVDLPQPDGPTKTQNSRSSIVEVDALDDLRRRRSSSAMFLRVTVAMAELPIT